MASKTQTTERIRANKARPSKANLKVDRARLVKSLEVLRNAAEPEQEK